jgi:very-short-patch-repair endonuclease
LCFAARLVVELDGEPHDKPEQIEHDARRDAWLESQVFKVLRFKNDIVLGNAELALEPIAEVLCGPSTDRA